MAETDCTIIIINVMFNFCFFFPYRSTDWQVGAEIGFGCGVERQRDDRRRRAVCSARAPVDNGRVPDRAHGDEDNVLKTLRPCFVRVKLLYYVIVVKWNFVLDLLGFCLGHLSKINIL